jgi:hypothetical protein
MAKYIYQYKNWTDFTWHELVCRKIPFSIKSFMSLNAVFDEILLIFAHFELCNLPSKLSNSIDDFTLH